MFAVSEIEDPRRDGFIVEIDGVKRHPGHIKISSRYGIFEYGKRPEGFVGWAFREPGGVNTIPFSVAPDGRILVGLIPENRSNISDKPVLCAIGGIVNPAEIYGLAQTREAREEADFDASAARELPGSPGCWNRLYHVIAGGAGLRTYAAPVPFASLEKMVGKNEWRLKSPAAEKSRKIIFLDCWEAVETTPDVIARAAIAQLLADIWKNRQISCP